MQLPEGRKKFNTFDKKDARIFSSVENLHYITSEKELIVYHAKGFNKSIFHMTQFRSFEENFLKKNKMKSYSISFTILDGLPFSLPSLQIQICKNGKRVYSAIIVTFSKSSNSPLLLVSRTLKKNLLSILQNILNCEFISISPTLLERNWLIGIVVHETLRKKGKPASDMTLTFKLPTSFLAECEASLTADSLFSIWKNIPGSFEDSLDIEVVDVFLNSMIEHFSQTYGINFHAAPIISIGLKDVCVHFNNQLIVSLHKPQMAFSLLSFLEADCCNY